MMSIYNLREYNNIYSKTSESLWQYYRNELVAAIEHSESFKPKIRITGKPLLMIIQKMLK